MPTSKLVRTASRAAVRPKGTRQEMAMHREHSIELLNKAVADELAAVHQYMYFHFHLDDQGFAPLAGLFKRTAIQEMGHVEALAERILFLKGDTNMVASGNVDKIRDPVAMLAKAMHMEEGSTRDYNQWVLECSAGADAASKQLFEKLIHDEEGHFDNFEKQLENIKRFGPNYLALESFGGNGMKAEAAR
jgi:bacterioferritin